VVLALSLTTELFAKNSPSVLYSSAVDMIRASDAVNRPEDDIMAMIAHDIAQLASPTSTQIHPYTILFSSYSRFPSSSTQAS